MPKAVPFVYGQLLSIFKAIGLQYFSLKNSWGEHYLSPNTRILIPASTMPFLVFYIPCPDEATAQSIATKMLDLRLAACANIFPIQCAYWWQGAVQREGEWVLVLKTRSALEPALEQAVQLAHPYETPCILRFEARANAAYEHWITQETS
jgi:periplasmic divalent cation tolerance protein